jgi:hypothetical protein
MNALHMVIAVAQLGTSQMRHMVKHAHSSVCQIFYNCMSRALAHLQDLEHGSEEFGEMTLVTSMHVALGATIVPDSFARSSTLYFALLSNMKQSRSK